MRYFMAVGSNSYCRAVTSIHKSFQTALGRAKTRQAVLNAYWKHKREHERLLSKHLKEEMAEVKRIKGKIDYR